MANENEISQGLASFIVLQSNVITDRLEVGFKGKTPVKTGRARDGWNIANRISTVGETAKIVNDVPYIGWLNFGTPYIEPHHMVEKTVQAVQQDYK